MSMQFRNAPFVCPAKTGMEGGGDGGESAERDALTGRLH